RRELQDDFAAQVGALREEMSSLRRELSEQWDSELRVERMVMRTQSVRLGSDRRESMDADSIHAGSIDSAGRPYIDAVGGIKAPGGGTTGIAAPSEPPPYQPAAPDQAEYEPAPYQPAAPDQAEYEVSYRPAPPEPAAYEPPSLEPRSYVPFSAENLAHREPAARQTFDAGPATHEFPAVTSEFPAVTSEFPAVTNSGPPVPPARPSWSSSPPFPDYTAQTPAQPDPEDDDVLTRVLAEAGGSDRGRRRKHRYADEDEDGGPVGF
ncbi:MAG: hypothetical protein H0X18_16645, partial [Geodermatophilaceae bacterium]|nr:hypothetical protein [Geodermatophilaceae bacterium]